MLERLPFWCHIINVSLTTYRYEINICPYCQKVYIDSNGDAEGNYTVITLQNDVGSGTSLGSLAKMSMQPVGFFAYDKNSLIPVGLL